MKTATKIKQGVNFDIKGCAKYTCDQIEEIIKKFGPRAPGSDAEHEAQKHMAKELEQWSEEVDIEGFTVHRQGFMGFIPFTVLMGILASLLFKSNPLIGLILVILGAIPLVLEFVMYKQFIDKLFPSKTSHNVIATRKASGETKKRIILCGHSDSQFEWTLNYLLGGNGMKAILIPAVVGLVVAGVASAVKVIVTYAGVEITGGLETFFTVVQYALYVFIPFFIGFLFFQNPFKSVPGANDNLTGCYVGMCVSKLLSENDIRFEDTDVVVMLSGSEEAGLRGAKAYVKAHKDELHDENIETICIALDTFRDMNDMAVYDRDLSGTLKHDKQVKELVKQAGENCGKKLSYESIYIGASDAAAFTQGGVKATGFAAMDPTPPRYYHTRLDNYDMLVPEAIELGVEITLEAVCMYANDGLK